MVNPRKITFVGVALLLVVAICALAAGQVAVADEGDRDRGRDGKERSRDVALMASASGGRLPQSILPIAVTPPDKQIEDETARKAMFLESFSNQLPNKPTSYGRVNIPLETHQGGEDIASAKEILSLPAYEVGTTSGYADDYDEVCPYSGSTAPDVVYSFTPGTTVTVDISLCNSTYDTKLYLYENSYSPGSPYACNDDNCPGYRSLIEGVTLTGGNTYYIVVDGYGSDYGDYVLEIDEVTVDPPACAMPCPTSGVSEGEACVTNGSDATNGGCNSAPEVYGSINPGDTVCGTAWGSSSLRDTDWFFRHFDGDTTVTFGGAANFQMDLLIVDLRFGCGSASVFDAVTISECDTGSVTVVIPAGDWAFFVGIDDVVAYDDRFNCANGPWEYWVTLEAADAPGGPDNNNCADATPIGDVFEVAWSTTAATSSGLGSYISSPDVFFCYTASCDGIATATMCGTSWDTRIAVYDGCSCASPVELGHDDDDCDYNENGGSGLASKMEFPVVNGNTYLIQCGGYGSNTGDGILTVSCEEVVALTNDNCADAEVIGDVVDYPFSTDVATFDGPGACLSSPNIWYSYTATCNGNLSVDLCGSDYDTKLAIYSGSCAAPVLLDCNDDDCGLDSKVDVAGVTIGETFLIEVGGYSSSTGDGDITITCSEPPPNDNCEDVTPTVLTSGVTETFYGDNTGATEQCPSFPDGHVWEAFTVPDTCMDVTLTYCGTSPAFGNAWLNLSYGCPCDSFTVAGSFDTYSCGDGNVSITWTGLRPGTYYYPVLNDPGNDANGPYQINVTGTITECVHCAAGANTCDEYIERVQVGDIDNSSSCDFDDNYSDYRAMSTLMYTGVGYPFQVDNGYSYSSDELGVWVDWNQDLDFDDPGESIAVSGSPGGGPYTGSITPPGDALLGPTTMRIRLTWNTTPEPCGFDSYGEVEDYTIIVDDFTCGDCDGDDVVDMNDIVCLEDFYFFFGAIPIPLISGDVNCDGNVNIADIVFVSDFLYRGGAVPCCIP